MNVTISLTKEELSALNACISGELDNDDGFSGSYMNPLRRVARKIEQAREDAPPIKETAVSE